MGIPRIIHYCWFGGKPLPELAVKCINSWKTCCPDYEIIRWDESNFDIEKYPYAKEAFEAKKWAFVTDIVRLHALVSYGGIYMDTDVEVIKSLDNLLNYRAFSGFESDSNIPTGTMGAEKGHPLFIEFLNDYENSHFLRPDGTYDLTTNVTRITKICLTYGLIQNNTLQTVGDFTLLPKDYLCAKDPGTKELTVTDNTYTIHHFDGSWHTPKEKYVFHRTSIYRKLLPVKTSHRIAVLQYYITHPKGFWEDICSKGISNG